MLSSFRSYSLMRWPSSTVFMALATGALTLKTVRAHDDSGTDSGYKFDDGQSSQEWDPETSKLADTNGHSLVDFTKSGTGSTEAYHHPTSADSHDDDGWASQTSPRWDHQASSTHDKGYWEASETASASSYSASESPSASASPASVKPSVRSSSGMPAPTTGPQHQYPFPYPSSLPSFSATAIPPISDHNTISNTLALAVPISVCSLIGLVATLVFLKRRSERSAGARQDVEKDWQAVVKQKAAESRMGASMKPGPGAPGTSSSRDGVTVTKRVDDELAALPVLDYHYPRMDRKGLDPPMYTSRSRSTDHLGHRQPTRSSYQSTQPVAGVTGHPRDRMAWVHDMSRHRRSLVHDDYRPFRSADRSRSNGMSWSDSLTSEDSIITPRDRHVHRASFSGGHYELDHYTPLPRHRDFSRFSALSHSDDALHHDYFPTHRRSRSTFDGHLESGKCHCTQCLLSTRKPTRISPALHAQHLPPPETEIGYCDMARQTSVDSLSEGDCVTGSIINPYSRPISRQDTVSSHFHDGLSPLESRPLAKTTSRWTSRYGSLRSPAHHPEEAMGRGERYMGRSETCPPKHGHYDSHQTDEIGMVRRETHDGLYETLRRALGSS